MTTRRSAILHNMRGRLVSGGLGCITTGPSAGRGAQASRAEGPEVSVELRRGAFFVPSGSLTGWVNRAWCFSSGTTRSFTVDTPVSSSAFAWTRTTTSSHTWRPSICSSRFSVSDSPRITRTDLPALFPILYHSTRATTRILNLFL